MRLKPTIIRFESIGSTNTEAARQAALGAPEGLCVIAREQTAGRGRQGRSWISPAGAGLYFSILLRSRVNPREWPIITMMAALAVSDALRKACGLATDIKWPNDVLAGGRKVCGILGETVETPQGHAVVIGVGINLTAYAYPAELRDIAISVEELTGKSPDAEPVVNALVVAIGERYAILEGPGGIESTLAAWTAASSYASGKLVNAVLGDRTVSGETRGLASDGALRIETAAGEIVTIRAGDVVALRPRET